MRTLRFGSSGEEVKLLQTLLGGLEADGIFGKLTYVAVVAYQKANGLDTDGIVGPKTWSKLFEQKEKLPEQHIPEVVTGAQPVDYKQFDSRWGNIMFSNHGDPKQTIGNAGCGPTSMADIVATWWDPRITPVEMCKFATDNGYRTYDSGVSGEYFGAVAGRYGAKRTIRSGAIGSAISCLDDGGLVVVCFGPGKWTSGGHFCLLWDYANNTFKINDPGSNSRTTQIGTYNEVKNQARGYWCIYK